MTHAERFERFVERVPSGCWEWRGCRSRDGYGVFQTAPGYYLAHRYAFETLTGKKIGPLPLDHLCRNRGCVNPDHLEPVTIAVNVLRSNPATKTHCKNGHVFDAANTYRRKTCGRRTCRLCNLAANKRYHQRLALARKWQIKAGDTA